MTLRPMLFVLAFATALSPALPTLAHDTSHAPAMQSHGAAITIGDIEITGPFTRATLPNAPVAGGFLTLTNKGSEDDRLVDVETPIAKEGQIHEMAMEGDVMKMRQLADGIVIPAGETVELAPGGLHLMFMGLNSAIAEGDAVPVTLTFEKAGTITVDLIAGGTAASGAMDHGAMNHGEMSHDSMSHDAHADHDNGVTVDQTGLSDVEAIAAMQKAMFDSADNPLDMGPISVAGDYAVSGWAQGGAGGRALLRKTDSGWAIHLCAGAGLKDAAELIKIGVPEHEAHQLAAQVAEAEAELPAETIALYDSFDGVMMIDEALI